MNKLGMENLVEIILWIIFFLVIGGLIIYKIISNAGG